MRTYTLPSEHHTKATLVVYYDSMECSSCQINKLYVWREALTMARASGRRFCMFFIIAPKRNEIYRIRNSITGVRLNYPVYIDSAHLFRRFNPMIPDNRAYHTFLLDSANRIVLVGNPIGNPKLQELYYQEIHRLIGK